MHVDKKVPYVLQIKYIVNYAFPIYFYKHYTCTCIFYILQYLSHVKIRDTRNKERKALFTR